MVTKKDFRAVAEIIKNDSPANDKNAKYDNGIRSANLWIARELADYFAKQNPRFGRKRFMKACGLQAESKVKK